MKNQFNSISFIIKVSAVCMLVVCCNNGLISQNTITQPTTGTTTLYAGIDFFSGDFYEDSGLGDDGVVFGNYTNNENGTLTFCPCPGEQFSIEFNQFDLDSYIKNSNLDDDDTLYISGAISGDGAYSSLNSPGTLTSVVDGCISFTFISSRSYIAPGWRATFSPGIGQTFYADEDGDGFGDPNNSITTCSIPPRGFVTNSSDDCPQVFGLMFDPCDDGNEYTGGDILNESCVCVGPIAIPTLSQWGLIVLGLSLFVFSILAIRKKQPTILKE